jgi:hypothetical protein
MGIEFTGHVLRAPRIAPGNSATSSPPENGVVRDVQVPPARTAADPLIVDFAGDQYRAAVLEGPGTSPHEYLVWTAVSSQLAQIEDATWWMTDGTGSIPAGETFRVIVTDDGGRDIGQVTHLVIARGDVAHVDEGWVDLNNPAAGRLGSTPYYVVVPAIADQDPVSGVVTLKDSNVFTATGAGLVASTLVTLFGTGLSLDRGDAVMEARYTLSSVKFWWTRNDRYETRFGWNTALQRWMPYKGSAPVNLGRLLFDTTYKLSPPLSNLPVGSVLPGDALVGDQYAMLRLGSSAGALSLPVGVNDVDGFTGVEVVADSAVESLYDFTASTMAAVVGQTNGILQFNPLYTQEHAGQSLWYVYRGFAADADGVVGTLIAPDDLFLAPVPGPTDRPFVRINNRTPLAVTLVADEAALGAVAPVEGACAIALTTGRLKLSTTDIDKSDPTKLGTFGKHFLGAVIVYDGVALNATPQPTKGPRPLVQADGVTTTVHPVEQMYLPAALPWPEDAGGGIFSGLGISGVLHMPDKTGAIPDPEGVNPAVVVVPVRPGGDALPAPGGGVPPQTIGLIRQIEDGVGDTILFSKAGAVEELIVVDRNSDLPDFPFDVPGGVAYIAREATTVAAAPHSAVQLGSETRTAFAGQVVYFLQASLNPSTYTETAVLYSKSRIVFRFEGDEVLYFASDGVAHDWHASTLPVQAFYTSTEVAASIQARITAQAGTAVCRAAGDRVLIEAADPTTGWVEIGWGFPKDLSGASALGFLPGWRVLGGQPNWLTDAGVSMGLSRSLLNLDRSKPDADYLAQYRLEDTVLATAVQGTPFTFFDFPPVEDIAGFDDGVFFNLQTIALQGDDLRIIDKRLGHLDEIEHRFTEGKFAWLDSTVSSNLVQQRTSVVNLGNPSIVPEALLPAPGINGNFLAAEDAARYVAQQQGVDYLITDDGVSGNVQLVTRYGARVDFGGQGTFTLGGTTFEDPDANFVATMQPGTRLKLPEGSYFVDSVTDATHAEVSPPFISSSTRATPWEAFAGFPDSVYDPAIVADQVFKPFDHLPDEPFRIRVLSPLGDIVIADFTANVEDANTSGRPVSLRFGAVAPGAGLTASLSPLTLTTLGVVANNLLVLPSTTHVDEAAFSIRVGTELHEQGVGLLPVAAFTADPVNVEYLTAAWNDGLVIHPKGELKFNSVLLVDLESSAVVLVETLRLAVNLTAGAAEYDQKTGDIRIAAADVTTHAGTQLYFTEQMITRKPGADVAISPMVGAVSFRKPINKGSLVEIEYWLADSEGRRVGTPADRTIEFLPVFVRREAMVRLTDHEFNLDPNGSHVIDTRIKPVVYLGPKQQNFGKVDFTVDTPKHLLGQRISFNRDLATWIVPEVNYAVFDALGGERAFQTSQKPVYRPPFFIKAGKDNFGLRGNRSADFEVGQMLRIGPECFYITEIRYFAGPDTTRFDIYPSTVGEVGSRSPGNDVLTLVTAGPITPTLDPDGAVPIATAAPLGFMQEIVLADFPFEPVNAKQNSVTFLGDLTTFAVPGHIMEFGGLPFTIASASLSEDGTRTKIIFTSPFRLAIDPAGLPTVRLSYRPVYPPEVRQFVGVGPYVASEGVDLTLSGEFIAGVEQPGRTLAEGTEFEVDPETGAVQLLAPLQEPLGPKQKLLLSFTKIRVMEPFYSGGQVQFPRWAAQYKHIVVPSVDNGYLGGTLTARYTFDNPDSFYFRALPLRSYLGEAVTQAVAEMQQGQSSGGPLLSSSVGTSNWQQGNLGLASQRRDLLDKDRAARSLLTFYNNAVVAFEQVEEAITGKFIGDRDGKFRFWVGRGEEYAPPGFEDEYTGELNPSIVWSSVFNATDLTRDIQFLTSDPLVRPTLCTLVDLQLFGEPLGASQLRGLMDQQRALIRNDVDDVVLLASSTPRIIPTNAPPYFTVESDGTFARMGSAHRYSRLFPTTTEVFFTLMPGIEADVSVAGDVGSYAWNRITTTGTTESTYRAPIGQVGNPVMGAIGNISEKVLQMRLPRARILSYHPEGLDNSAFGLAVPLPCVVVSNVPLADLPMDPATGFPDVSRFLSQNVTGDTADAVAGDPVFALPGFEVGQRIGWGKPDGRLLAALFPEEVDVFGSKTYTGLFINEVLHGCVLTFRDRQDNAISDPNQILVGTSPTSGIAAHIFGLIESDTIYVVPPDTANPISDPATESPTMEMQQQAALLSPAFRQGFDLAVDTSGQVKDLSLPSWGDPSLFPIKELLGQKTPEPMSHLEGVVDFANVDQLPLRTPALLGNPQDDAGDYAIPYMKGTNTELARFEQITNVIGPLMAADAVDGGYFPDEILFVDGEVPAAPLLIAGLNYREPGALMVPTKTDPAATLGTAPGREGDFLLMEVNTASPQGYQGILTVGGLRNVNTGGADWSWIEPPRFVTQVNQGSATRFILNKYAVHTTPGVYPVDPQVVSPPGVRIFDDIANGNTVLSFQDVVFALNDAAAINVGNLNTVLAAHADNAVRVNLISRPDDTVVNGLAGAVSVANMKDGRVILTIHIRAGFARVTDYQGGDTGWIAHAGVTFGGFDPVGGEPAPGAVADNRHIIISGWSGQVPFTPAVGTEVQWFMPHDHLDPAGANDRKISKYGWEFGIDLDTSVTGESTSAYIDSDRLTFHEVVDFRLARPRGFQHDNGVGAIRVYQTMLRVTEVTLGGAVFSIVNDVIGAGLSIRSRDGSTTTIEGTWNPAPTPAEEGSIRVMAFEFANTGITVGDSTASVVASQTTDPSGSDILIGDGWAEEDRIDSIVATTGDMDNVQKGDAVYIDRSATALPDAATEKAGTFITRFAIKPTAGPNLYLPVAKSTYAGTGNGFVTTRFPRVLSLDVLLQRMEIDDHLMLPATGKLFIAIRPADLNSAVLPTFTQALFSVNWTAFDLGGPNPKLVLGAFDSWRWADDTPIGASLAAIALLISNADVVGRQMTWHDNPPVAAAASASGVMQVNVSVRGGDLPDDSSVVGHHSIGPGATDAAYGFHGITYETAYGPTSVPVVNMVAVAPTAGKVRVTPGTPHTNETFDPTNAVPVYFNVPRNLHFHIDATQGDTLNNPQGHVGLGNGIACLLPGTEIRTEDAANNPAFFALGGVFLEPSTPMFPPSLDPGSTPNVVDATRSMGAGAVGMRSSTTAEQVHFEVRRVRRWHGQQNAINDAFRPLQYAYEIRRGIVTAFARNEQQVGMVTALNFQMDWAVANPALPRVADVWNDNDGELHSGTNLGPFNSGDVNINPGDIFRLLDDNDVVLEEAVVAEVVSGSALKLRAPGFSTQTAASVVGRRFEVWLRQAPVPHEQSNEQLLNLITDSVVHVTAADHSDADPQNWVGGYVPETAGGSAWADVSNKLLDDSAGGVDFTALGVRADDIVIIDPMGTLPVVDERGARPLGDRSVPTRTPAGAYQAGPASSLDDNRGFYRVATVAAGELGIDPIHLFAGTLGGDVLMAPVRTALVYAIYPTVSTSVLSTDAAEGQNDLRPTRKAVGGTFTSGVPVEDKHSMRPFSYRVIRPSSLFSSDIVDTVLMMRERMLSLIELFRSSTKGTKGGFYWTWQDADHVEDLGDPADPDSGLGLFPNRLVTTIVGETSRSPFVNTNDCLSILDRRFWIHDTKLDLREPDPNNPFGMREATGGVPFDGVGGPYTAYTDVTVGGSEVRPVLTDHLNLVLDVRDRLRDIRYTWLAYRTHRYIGTLARIAAFDAALPVRLEERERAMLLESTAGEVTE